MVRDEKKEVESHPFNPNSVSFLIAATVTLIEFSLFRIPQMYPYTFRLGDIHISKLLLFPMNLIIFISVFIYTATERKYKYSKLLAIVTFSIMSALLLYCTLYFTVDGRVIYGFKQYCRSTKYFPDIACTNCADMIFVFSWAYMALPFFFLPFLA